MAEKRSKSKESSLSNILVTQVQKITTSGVCLAGTKKRRRGGTWAWHARRKWKEKKKEGNKKDPGRETTAVANGEGGSHPSVGDTLQERKNGKEEVEGTDAEDARSRHREEGRKTCPASLGRGGHKKLGCKNKPVMTRTKEVGKKNMGVPP